MPQIIVNYRRHDAEGLQPSMMLLWAAAGVPLGVYNIVEEQNIALRIQPQILSFLSLVTWAQCFYYGRVRVLPCPNSIFFGLTKSRNAQLSHASRQSSHYLDFWVGLKWHWYLHYELQKTVTSNGRLS